jgi:guanylate kinase
MKLGQLIVITGPSGVGKGTLVRSLLERHQQLYLSVSATTRTPRPGEIEGKNYYFVSGPQFEAMIKAGELLEWAQYAGNYYGTPRAQVQEKLNQGQSVLLEIEVLGARQIKESFPHALRLFILPPSVAELERRLRGRGNDVETAIAQRLEQAKVELEASREFDREIVNDDLQIALKEIEAAIFGEC